MLKPNGEVGISQTVEIRGAEIPGIRESAWHKLASAGAGHNLMSAFAADKQRERELEDSRS